MIWQLRHRADTCCLKLANRHYNRQTHDSPQFAPPGRCVVLFAETPGGCALWVTSHQKFTLHRWGGAWVCSVFRNEGAGLSSALIVSALAATRAIWGEPPEIGCITFVNPGKVKPKKNPGFCFLAAGFQDAGRTKVNNLIALQLPGRGFPKPQEPRGFQRRFDFWEG